MIIDERNLDVKGLFTYPIYLLTGDFETAKFFSCLASACCKFGYYIENIVRDNMSYPYIKVENIGENKSGKHLLYKPKFGSEVPDYVLIDEDNKIIYVYEMKVNLKSMDSKKAHGEKAKYQRLKLFLEENYKKYTVSVFVVNYLGVDGRNCSLYKNLDFLSIITGEEFCKSVNVSYDKLMNLIKESQKTNQEFIKLYKEKLIDPPSDIKKQKETNLLNFMV